MKKSRFFLIMPLLFLTIVFIGFSRTLYFSSYFESEELPIHLILHGIVLTIWFVIAATQPALIRRNNIQTHRRLGIFGVIIACAVFVLSVLTLVIRDAPTIDEFPDRATANLLSLFMFGSCVALGFKFRSKPAMHRRLMLFASIPLVAPALDRMARIPIFNKFFGEIFFWFSAPPEVAFATVVFISLIISVVVYDLIYDRRIHPGTLWGLGGILLIAPTLTASLTLTGAWTALVRVLI